MRDSSDFQKGRMVVARLTGASLIKTASFFGVSSAAVSKVMMAYTNHGETSPAKRNSGRKPKLSERDCRPLKTIVSKNHRTAAAQVTAVLNSHHEDPVSIKTVRRELHKSNYPRESCNC